MDSDLCWAFVFIAFGCKPAAIALFAFRAPFHTVLALVNAEEALRVVMVPMSLALDVYTLALLWLRALRRRQVLGQIAHVRHEVFYLAPGCLDLNRALIFSHSENLPFLVEG